MNTAEPKKTHTITIRFTGPDTWSYDIDPKQPDPKRARIKRNEILQWMCADGTWTVFFKDLTPLENSKGVGIARVSAGSGETAGGTVAAKPNVGDVFSYGVKLVPNGSKEPVETDPEIVIEA